jgi:hypothetical protein
MNRRGARIVSLTLGFLVATAGVRVVAARCTSEMPCCQRSDASHPELAPMLPCCLKPAVEPAARPPAATDSHQLELAALPVRLPRSPIAARLVFATPRDSSPPACNDLYQRKCALLL